MSTDNPIASLIPEHLLSKMETWAADPGAYRLCEGTCGEELTGLVAGSDGRFRCDPCEIRRLEEERAAAAILRASGDREQALRAVAKVPAGYLEVPFDPNPPPCDAAAFATALAWQGDPWSLLLWGKVGNGKSMLGVELLHRAMCRGQRALFVRTSRVPTIWYERGGEEKERLLAVPVLLLDEIGAGHPGGGWEPVSDLLSTRWEERLPTITTSNLSLRDLAAGSPQFGGRIADRLNDGLRLPLTGPSRRGLKG